MDPATALERMIERSGASVFGADDVARETAHGDWILLFAGDPHNRPEVADLAVILPEIVKGRAGALKFAVVERADEEALAAQIGVFVRPSLVFLREGAVMGVIPRVKDWAYYEKMLNDYLPIIT